MDLLWDEDQDPVARFVGALRMARDLGVEFDVGPWVRAAEALTKGERPALEDIATLSDWDGVDAEMWSDPAALPRLMGAMIDAAANTAEDYHRRYRESEVIEEVNEALGARAITLPQLIEEAGEIGDKAEALDGVVAALSRILGALGAPAPTSPRGLTEELEGAIERYCRATLTRTLAEAEGAMKRLSLNPDDTAENRARYRAALEAWRWTRTGGPPDRGGANGHVGTWEATPAQSMGVASATELALLLGVDPAEVDRALVKSAGDRARALAALRQLCERRRIQEANADRTIRARDDIDRWARRHGEVLAALGPFARDPEWVGVLHRMISELTDALGNGHLPPRDLVIVSEQVLAASSADLLALRVVQAEARALIERQRADRMEAALRMMSAPSMTAVPWPLGVEIADALTMAELAAAHAQAAHGMIARIAEEPADVLETVDPRKVALEVEGRLGNLCHTTRRVAEILVQFIADNTHMRSDAGPVVVE